MALTFLSWLKRDVYTRKRDLNTNGRDQYAQEIIVRERPISWAYRSLLCVFQFLLCVYTSLSNFEKKNLMCEHAIFFFPAYIYICLSPLTLTWMSLHTHFFSVKVYFSWNKCTKPGCSQKRPVCTQKRLVYKQKRPAHSLKRRIYSQNRPIYSHKRPIYSQKRPIYSQKRPIYSEKRPMYTHTGPYVICHSNGIGINWKSKQVIDY